MTDNTLTLKQTIEKMLKEDADDMQPTEVRLETLQFTTYFQCENLILDEIKIEKLTPEDKDYLSTFTNLESLRMNQCSLTSLENLPDCEDLLRLELGENQLTGAELQHLKKYAESLTTLKLAAN